MDSPTCSQKNCDRLVERRLNGDFFRSCAKCRARRAAWQRRKEAERIANGDCRSCGRPLGRDAGSSSDRCAACRAQRRQRVTAPTKAGVCRCGHPRDQRPDGTLYYRCPKCRSARAKRNAELVEQGGCVKCYHRHRAAGDTLCAICRERYPEHLARRRKSEAARPPRQRTRRRNPNAPYRHPWPAGPKLPPEFECRNRCSNRRDQKPDGTLYAECRPCRERRQLRRSPDGRYRLPWPAGPKLPPQLKCRNRCSNRRDEKPDGTLYAQCRSCRERTKRRRAELVAAGGCVKCGYRQRADGDTHCPSCRIAKDAHNAEARELRRLAREIDEWAAKPEPRRFEPSAEDCGISRWNSRKPREATAAYWTPLPDPKPAEPDAYRYRRKFRRY